MYMDDIKLFAKNEKELETNTRSIVENGQNTEKSPGDLRRLAVTQTSMKNHQLTLM